MTLACEERAEFVGLLDELTPQQWDLPSLCVGWRVRDVVAHAFGFDELTGADLAGRMLRGRFSVARINELGVTTCTERTPEDLLAMAHAHRRPRGLTAGFGGRIALLDGMVHQQDIRRPLNVPRCIATERLRAALDFARFAPPVRGAWRARGVQLVVDDLDWSYGRGPAVHGSGEAILMAMAGRRVALDDLTGPGKGLLARHI
ncbi:MAG: maleylpyruvate isomerase family mycothiol-dependent enzyme [Mycobacterium sp.]